MNKGAIFSAGVFLVIGAVGVMSYFSVYFPSLGLPEVSVHPLGPRHFESDGVSFDLMDPEMAPDAVREEVLLGYKIMLHTDSYAKEFVGNTLSCNHCHFDAGNTMGDKNGGISLVGVSCKYPSYSKRDKVDITLRDRLDNCFMRSMNGKKVPHNHPIMNALIAYLDWISTPVQECKDISWLGLKYLKIKYKGDVSKGEELYANKCSACHQPNGGGTEAVPPLWGKNSFNDGAGMVSKKKFAAFIYANMPYQDANLSEEEAADLAAFVTKQPRPKFSGE